MAADSTGGRAQPATVISAPTAPAISSVFIRKLPYASMVTVYGSDRQVE
jgi:hypothetical protein